MLKARGFRLDEESSLNGVMLPPYYDAYGVQTIGVLMQNSTSHPTYKEPQLSIMVGASASAWHQQMRRVGIGWQHTQLAVLDRLGNVFVTHPSNYLQERCSQTIAVPILDGFDKGAEMNIQQVPIKANVVYSCSSNDLFTGLYVQ